MTLIITSTMTNQNYTNIGNLVVSAKLTRQLLCSQLAHSFYAVTYNIA